MHLGSRLVDIERPNDDELGARLEVTNRNRDLGDDVLDERVDVVPQLSRDGDDGRRVGHGALDKGEDRLVVLVRLLLADEVDLVLRGRVGQDECGGKEGTTNLEDENVLELHDLDSGEMLGSLGLRTGLVGGDKKEGGVHDRSTVEHGGHENVVTRAIDKGDVAARTVSSA